MPPPQKVEGHCFASPVGITIHTSFVERGSTVHGKLNSCNAQLLQQRRLEPA